MQNNNNNNKMKVKWQNSDPTQLERVNMKWDSLQTIKSAAAATTNATKKEKLCYLCAVPALQIVMG